MERDSGQVCRLRRARGRLLAVARRPWRSLRYGQFAIKGRSTGAHRVAYMIEHGPIPDGLSVLHRCDNPLCVRPDHLFLGTQAENMRDMAQKGRAQRWRAKRTHCMRGHEYTEANTRQRPDGRECRTCDREKRRRLRAAARAAA